MSANCFDSRPPMVAISIPSAQRTMHAKNGRVRPAPRRFPAKDGRTVPNTIRTSGGILLQPSPTGHLQLAPRPKPCMGYQNACVCPACRHREQHPKPAPGQPRQPWEAAA